MNDAARLLTWYRWIYGLACAVVASALAVAMVVFSRGSGLAAMLAMLPVVLLATAVFERLREFRRYAHVPGPRPSFFLGNLESLLLHQHGARDRALVELHHAYGPVVKVHMAWGSTPFVSLSVAPVELQQRDMDSNRRADRTVLPRSSMGLPRGEQHTAHRRQMTPHFGAEAVLRATSRLDEVASTFLESWRFGRTRHGSLKADLHHWSADSLGHFLCGPDWQRQPDLSHYLKAIATLEETISFRAFHPFFVRWLFPTRAGRARAAYRHLFNHLDATLERRLQRRRTQAPQPGEPRDVLETLAALQSDAAAGARWSRAECVEELISLVAGGTDAMSYTLGQALHLLARNPEVQEQARRYAASPASSAKGPADPFALHVLHETMRLFPAVPFSSKISQSRAVEVLGVTIPAGTNVMWMKTAVGLNEQLFTDARRFDPLRFAAGPAGGRPHASIASAMPFGAGLRHCIGRHLAEYLCTRFLGAILREFELSPIHDQELRYSATVSVTPSSVPVRLTRRRDLHIQPPEIAAILARDVKPRSAGGGQTSCPRMAAIPMG